MNCYLWNPKFRKENLTLNIKPCPIDDIIVGKWYAILTYNGEVVQNLGLPFKVLGVSLPFITIGNNDLPKGGRPAILDLRLYELIDVNKKYVNSYFKSKKPLKDIFDQITGTTNITDKMVSPRAYNPKE